MTGKAWQQARPAGAVSSSSVQLKPDVSMITGTTTEAAPAASGTGLAHYRLDPEQSKFTAQAFAEGLLSAFGHDPVLEIKDFTGEAQFVAGSFEAASLKMTIKAAAIVVSDAVKEKDRHEIEQTMREQVLETERYPEIVFASSSISVTRLAEGRYRARVIGDVTFHGVTQKNLWITAQVSISEETLRAQGDFSLKQNDFGIKPFSAAGGTINLRSELKLSFEIVAVKEG
jgi:polyisoprenoid-binding protein YceI